jgi:hypothetical protein
MSSSNPAREIARDVMQTVSIWIRDHDNPGPDDVAVLADVVTGLLGSAYRSVGGGSTYPPTPKTVKSVGLFYMAEKRGEHA